jgi:hypothetical protein
MFSVGLGEGVGLTDSVGSGVLGVAGIEVLIILSTVFITVSFSGISLKANIIPMQAINTNNTNKQLSRVLEVFSFTFCFHSTFFNCSLLYVQAIFFLCSS